MYCIKFCVKDQTQYLILSLKVSLIFKHYNRLMMLVIDKTKRYKNILRKILRLLFYVVVFSCTNICYANDLAKLDDIKSLTKTEYPFFFTDNYDGTFNVMFIAHNTENLVLDSQANYKIGDFEGVSSYFNCNIAGVNFLKLGAPYRCYMLGEFNKSLRATADRHFVIQVKEKIDHEKKYPTIIDTIEGEIPELIPKLESSKTGGPYDILRLTNYCSEEIKIINIEKKDGYFTIEDFETPRTIHKNGGTDVLNLKPTYKKCSNKNLSDELVIEYQVGDNNELAEIEIVINIQADTDIPPPQLLPVCPPNSGGSNVGSCVTEPLSLAPDPKYKSIPPIHTGLAQTLIYRLENKSSETIKFKVSDFDMPIYRDDASSENCGDELAGGESCELKYSIYTLKPQEINQLLKVSSEALPKELTADVHVTVNEHFRLLQILPTVPNNIKTAENSTASDPPQPNDETEGSIKSVMLPGQDELHLEYWLKNNSIGSITIESVRVEHSQMDSDPLFEFEHKNHYKGETIDAGLKYKIGMTFKKPKDLNSKTFGKKVGIHCTLTVKFDKDKMTTIPILISNE